MPTTLSVIDRPRGAGARRARLYLVLEASRPLAGSARWSLADLDEARIGRGEARRARRSRDAGISLLSLEVPDARMSQSHARLARLGGRWVLEDLDSKNGVLVNGARARRAELASGDLLELGGTHFWFEEALEQETDPGDLDSATDAGIATVLPSLAHRLAELDTLAASPVSILIRGETGTGKELAAKNVHARSGRRGRFVAVNCGALPEKLVESELFGSRRGAFTGATEDRPGLLRAADGGTLLLDEVGDLPKPAQAALLRALQEREVLPVGASTPVPVDFRLIAATHRDLGALVASGDFREDLLARLRGFELELPPLRERTADLGLITATLLSDLGQREASLSLEAARALVQHSWPQNVRELAQALAVGVELAKGGSIELEHLPKALRERPAPAPTRELEPHDHALRDQLVQLLREHDGNLSAVARAMNKDRKQIRRWVERFGLRLRSE